MFTSASVYLFVCVFLCVCLFICQHDNFRTSNNDDETWEVSTLYKNLGRVRICGSPKCAVKLRRLKNQRRLSSFIYYHRYSASVHPSKAVLKYSVTHKIAPFINRNNYVILYSIIF